MFKERSDYYLSKKWSDQARFLGWPRYWIPYSANEEDYRLNVGSYAREAKY